MTGSSVVHCDTCTCSTPDSIDVYCDSTVERAHETFGCLEAAGHDGKHQAGAVVWPPCPACDGLDVHTTTCPLLHAEASGDFADLTWDDDGDITFAAQDTTDDRAEGVAAGLGAAPSAGPPEVESAGPPPGPPGAGGPT